ncbi:phosphoribosylformylglycinamidine cyclo-ligase [Mucisphaera calidilacus]|uniref:Phosphoribosylformylglycinamidine cyclo-ligase n=1 Tax=Mucisphaera calidilacus TaxID=2527982 RepID=A0A518BZJ3_9BACT|nr:phosphoribosylformylglycinamidine cyclo-ligase [Mucisphaera calidilacus]QDU72386.1 Phosphoribosylformylglycinamidine cyclo-ligase [Mucisphaera calidilacus]
MPPRKKTAQTPQSAQKGISYADAGVDIDAGDLAVQRILGHLKRTHTQRVLENEGGFAGLFRLDFNERLFKRNYRDPVLVAATDGVGTKVLLAIQMDKHDTIGQDLVAMSVNDMAVQGAEPLFFLDYMALNKVEPALIERVVSGVAEACRVCGAALLGGETAEMPDLYEPGHYDLAGFAVGVVELKRAVDPVRVNQGDVVLGLGSSGVHSNGYSLVRAILKRKRLKLDRPNHELRDLGVDDLLGHVLLEPTRLYAAPITRLLRGYKVKRPISAMAHITGGGLPGNLNRSLPKNLDAVLDRSCWDVPPVFTALKRWGGVDDEEMLRVFNMGIGYCLVVRPHFADAVAERLRKLGERVYRIGRITRGTGRVRIK